MNPYALAAIVIGLVILVLAVHYVTINRAIKLGMTKTVHLKCAVCGLLVARYEQGHDLVLRCVNCIRTAEKKLNG